MDSVLINLVLLLPCVTLLIDRSASFPLCTDLRAPITLSSPLPFCSYNGSACCDDAKDQQLKKQFETMNISHASCSASMKAILCAQCDPYSASLFDAQSGQPLRAVPILCNSITSNQKQRSKQSTKGYCSTLWDDCHNVPIVNSPFQPSLRRGVGVPVNNSNPSSMLADAWQSEEEFCHAFGDPARQSVFCFDEEAILLQRSENRVPIKGICLEKIGNGSYLDMAAHPDDSNRVFLGNQEGKIWLATVPDQGSGGVLQLEESKPFLDLTEEVHSDAAFGMMGMALHPDFADNGRIFVSFNCDKLQNPTCHGRCACNSDVGCDPSKLVADGTGQPHPCRYHSVIAEYTANGTSSSKSTEIRRIFTIGLPSTASHGGQILFGPTDKCLYFVLGDGSSGDQYNFSQNKKSVMGKILRLDVNRIPSSSQIEQLRLWGNYSVPRDNPYIEDNELQKEVWALGLRNPWRCSFDSKRPNYFLCGDVGQDHYEEVDIISKDGNYGWSRYEGTEIFNVSRTIGLGNPSENSTRLIFPILGYTHSEVSKQGSASIVGGYIYRSMVDPCLYGRYLYADLYATAMWAATEDPEGSGMFNATRIPFACASDSPIPCSTIPGGRATPSGYIYSFGEDNRKDIFLLASTGVYRIVRPSRCNYHCSMENSTTSPVSSTAFSNSSVISFCRICERLMLLLYCSLFILRVVL